MNLIVLGPPGSGKGTQARMLAQKYGLFYLQTGSLSREWAKSNSRIRNIVESGRLIPQREMTKFIMKYLEKHVPDANNILLEGYPRFIDQYETYSRWLSKKGQKIDAIIVLDISEQAVVRRLSSRRTCIKCGRVYNLITDPPAEKGKCECGGRLLSRKDDNPKSIRVRFDYFTNNTKLLIDYLKNADQMIEVKADRPINLIFKDITERIDRKHERNKDKN